MAPHGSAAACAPLPMLRVWSCVASRHHRVLISDPSRFGQVTVIGVDEPEPCPSSAAWTLATLARCKLAILIRVSSFRKRPWVIRTATSLLRKPQRRLECSQVPSVATCIAKNYQSPHGFTWEGDASVRTRWSGWSRHRPCFVRGRSGGEPCLRLSPHGRTTRS